MIPALPGALVVLGWTPMLARLRAARANPVLRTDRSLLALTWILCIVLTAASAWDITHATPASGGRIGAGIALQWAAMGLWSWARTSMGPSFAQSGLPSELVERGPYRHLRHPMYVATALATLGMAIAGGHPRDVVMWGFLGIVLALRALREELVLRRMFGARWESYARGALGILPP